LSALATSGGVQPIYVDLMAAADKLEAINGALCDVAYTLKTRRSEERVRGVKALGMGGDFDVAPATPTSADAGQQLQHLVADLLRQPSVRRVLLLLDEVQELARSKDGDLTMKAIRAVANKHKVDGSVLMLMTPVHRRRTSPSCLPLTASRALAWPSGRIFPSWAETTSNTWFSAPMSLARGLTS
jgi:hypothetical protein